MLFSEYYHINLLTFLPKNIDIMIKQHEKIMNAKMEVNSNLTILEGIDK